MKRIKHLLFATCMLPTLVGAQGMANALFLELTPDAQSAGMGGTGLAITDNASTAIFHNASTIAFSQEVMGATYSYADIGKGFSQHSASLFYRIGREGKHGFTVAFRDFKEPNFPIGTGTNVADFRPHGWNVEAGYFRSITSNLSLSLTLKYLQARVSPNMNNKKTICGDFGASYHRNMSALDGSASWTIGFQAANLGGTIDGQKLPARLGLGGAVDLPFNMENSLQVAVDFNYLLPSEYRQFQAGIGAEYSFLKYGVVRGGYHFGDKDKGVGNYGTLGCGINFWPMRADFSYALAGDECFMRRTWQLSLGVVF